MKTILSILITLFFSIITIAQTTSIPDANFEQKLIDNGFDSGTIDGMVLTANINTVTALDVSNSFINDLTGIEAFTALSLLACGDNNLTSLNITQNTALTMLDCSNNNLTIINVNENLEFKQKVAFSNTVHSSLLVHFPSENSRARRSLSFLNYISAIIPQRNHAQNR